MFKTTIDRDLATDTTNKGIPANEQGRLRFKDKDLVATDSTEHYEGY
jgi:hypothetical protein